MPAFHEVQFPTAFSLGARGGLSFSTYVTISESGFEQRNANWSQTRGRWNVGYPTRTREDMATLQSFFRNRFGRAYGFRFRDHSDYSATDVTIGTGNNVEDDFQLVKVYASGGSSYTRNILKPITASVVDANNVSLTNTVNIYINDVLQTSGYTVSHATGIVHFTSPPSGGEVITADFEFDVPVRFNTDEMQIEAVTGDLFSWPSLEVIEIRQ